MNKLFKRARPSSPARETGAVTGRRPWAVLLCLAVTVLLVAGGILQFRIDTRVSSFLPGEDSAVKALDDKAEKFGGDPVVVMLESDEDYSLLLEQKQLQKLFALEGRLSNEKDVATVFGPATVLNQLAISAQGLLARISGSRDSLQSQAEEAAKREGKSPSAVKAAGQQALSEFDLRYGSLLVKGLPAGLPTLKNPKFIRAVIHDKSGEPKGQWHFVVPSADAVAIVVRPRDGLGVAEEEALTESIRDELDRAGLDTTRVTVSGSPAVTADLSQQVTKEFPLLAGLALLLLFLRFLLVPGEGSRKRRLLPLAAAGIGSALTLACFGWIGMPLSLGAVVLLPLLLGIGSSFPLYLLIVRNRRRVLVAACASAAAFGSLALSPLPFVRQLGIALAVGVLLTAVVSLVLIGEAPEDRRTPTPTEDPRGATPRPLGAGVRWTGVLLASAVAAMGAISLGNASISADPRELAEGLGSIHDAEHVESVLGSSGEVNVVLRGDDVLSPKALAWSRSANDHIVSEYGDQLQPVVSLPGLLDFLGPKPSATEITSGMDLMPSYVTSSVVGPGRQESLMTFGMKLQTLEDQHQLLDEVRSSLPAAPPGYSAELVGLPVAAAHGYELVSEDRYIPNVAGVLAAGLVLLLGLRRRGDALRAVVAALFATGWTFALLAVLGVGLNPLSVALGSLTTVTASEFCVLLLDAVRRGSRTTVRLVGWACATSAVGYLVLLPSSLSMLREFGAVLTASVLLSFAAAWAVVWLVPSRAPETAHTPAERPTSAAPIENKSPKNRVPHEV